MERAVISNYVYRYKKSTSSIVKGNVVFIHGFATTSKYHDFYANYLKDYNYYALELPGHGETPVKTNMPLSTYNIASQVIEWINLLNLDEIYLIGHSMGAGICEIISSFIPSKIEKIVLISPMNSSIDFKKLVFKRKFLFESTIDLYKWHDQILFDIRTLHPEGINRPLLEQELKYQKKNRETLNLLRDNLHTYQNYKQLKYYEQKNEKPTLVILGKYDCLVNYKKVIQLLGMKKNMQFNIFDYSGHIPFLEEPIRYVKIVNEFINSK